jgi:fucose 4-O-acetylase-like acetyltransferase
MRDKTLDKLKGLAILLVIAGHTIQSLDVNYDKNFYFRLIYSFHMPFFILLSGASASYWVNKTAQEEDFKSCISKLSKRIATSTKYLLLPFLIWTLINYQLGDKKVPLLAHLNSVSLKVDMSLWFLPAVFWCTTFLAVGLILLQTIETYAIKNSKLEKFFGRLDIRLLAIFSIWLLVRTKFPDYLGIGMTNFFHGGLFFYFLVGVFLHSHREKFQRFFYSLTCLTIFGLIVPFWSRVEPNNFMESVPRQINTFYIGALFTVLVASTGSCGIYLLGRKFFDQRRYRFLTIFSILGTYSLGIYAMHQRFILWQPYIAAPALVSLGMSVMLNRIPLVRVMLLGKRIAAK